MYFFTAVFRVTYLQWKSNISGVELTYRTATIHTVKARYNNHGENPLLYRKYRTQAGLSSVLRGNVANLVGTDELCEVWYARLLPLHISGLGE